MVSVLRKCNPVWKMGRKVQSLHEESVLGKGVEDIKNRVRKRVG